MVYHVLNRGNGRMRIFHKGGDYEAFQRVLAEGLERYPVEVFTYCLMPNHWHLVVRPGADDALGRWLGWVGVTHVRRYLEHYHSRGGGHLYQGRFKSFPVAEDDYFLTLCRYVEANALRAGLAEAAEQWRWSGLWQRAEEAAGLVGTGQPRVEGGTIGRNSHLCPARASVGAAAMGRADGGAFAAGIHFAQRRAAPQGRKSVMSPFHASGGKRHVRGLLRTLPKPAPPPLLGALREARSQGIGLDVATQGQEVVVLSHGKALEPPLVQVAAAPAVIMFMIAADMRHAHPAQPCPKASSAPGRTTKCQ